MPLVLTPSPVGAWTMSPPACSLDRLSRQSQPSHATAGLWSASAARWTFRRVRPQTSVDRTTVRKVARASLARTWIRGASPPTDQRSVEQHRRAGGVHVHGGDGRAAEVAAREAAEGGVRPRSVEAGHDRSLARLAGREKVQPSAHRSASWASSRARPPASRGAQATSRFSRRSLPRSTHRKRAACGLPSGRAAARPRRSAAETRRRRK